MDAHRLAILIVAELVRRGWIDSEGGLTAVPVDPPVEIVIDVLTYRADRGEIVFVKETDEE